MLVWQVTAVNNGSLWPSATFYRMCGTCFLVAAITLAITATMVASLD